MKLFKRYPWRAIGIICIAFLFNPVAHAVVYQYSVHEGGRTVYLWVPPSCRSVRGLIVSFKNLSEQRWLEDPQIRAAAADECLGVVWIGGGKGSALDANMGSAAGEAFVAMQRDLAQASGFPEIATAPILPMGHSAQGQFAWKFAEWAPERTIAVIPIKTVPLPADLNLRGVPLFYLVGETTEWPEFRDGRPGDRDYFWPVVRRSALAIRARDPQAMVAVAVDPGGGHFDWSEKDGLLVALFIRKACALRLPSETAGKSPSAPLLRPVAFQSGWMGDSGGVLPDRFEAAPTAQYKGPQDEAYWFFDREMAQAVAGFQGDRVQRKQQMLSVEQDGTTLPVARQGFAPLKFEPEADGIRFKLKPVFLDAMPAELIGAGTPLEHANGPIHMSVITGPARQVAADTFEMAWDREAMGGDVWIELEQTGDATRRKAVQPVKLASLQRLTAGAAQTIAFGPIADVTDETREIPLHATSSAGLPVRFFVASGPAEVDGDRIRITEVPQSGNQSIEVTVVAYQCGRMGSAEVDAVQTADPVKRSFHIARRESLKHGDRR